MEGKPSPECGGDLQMQQMSSSVLLLVESSLQFPTLRPLCITKALYMSLYVTIINHGREWELVVLFAVNRE